MTTRSHLATLFLFTKSDLKTVIAPQSVFAISIVLCTTAQQYDVKLLMERIPLMIGWIWFHLLIENISNQRMPQSILEDKGNKPWRPVASGRITPESAATLLRILIPSALLLSTSLGSITPSATLLVMIWLYNDLQCDSVGIVHRNILNAAGLACFGWGALSVLVGGVFERADLLLQWTLMTAAAVATTVHVQDLPDVVGDRTRGRQTMPLVYGENLARWSAAVLIPAWSYACLLFWQPSMTISAGLLAFSGMISLLTVVRRDQYASALAWKLWCVWVSCLYLLPMVVSPEKLMETS